MMIHGGIFGLRRNPHAAARSWLLKVPSSKAQRSTVWSTISWRSFFMLFLSPGIGSGQKGTGLAEPELELPEQPLALAHAQLDSIGFLDPCRQRLAIPEMDPHPCLARCF